MTAETWEIISFFAMYFGALGFFHAIVGEVCLITFWIFYLRHF